MGILNGHRSLVQASAFKKLRLVVDLAVGLFAGFAMSSSAAGLIQDSPGESSVLTPGTLRFPFFYGFPNTLSWLYLGFFRRSHGRCLKLIRVDSATTFSCRQASIINTPCSGSNV
ncbi:hypothetical protein C8R44DRAFT_787763 [Mycena epipterygia]|nr:hypothetical protein C8R44DRAFT_787763 [Mycena epipterygia]